MPSFPPFAVVVAVYLGTGCAHNEPRPLGTDEPRDPVDREPLHLRLTTSRGAVHVFRPSGYDAATAGTVLYVHGHFIDLSGACRNHDLTKQFRDSNLNALFISPEAPGSFSEEVTWPSLPELLAAVAATGVEVPLGPVVALAHSGGFRTVVPWLSSGVLESVILLDALYGNEDDFAAWLADSKDEHRLVLVGFDTTPRIERFLTNFPDEIERDAIPLLDVDEELATSRLVFIRSQFGHMELVTEGRAIPALLQLTPLAQLVHRG